MKKYVYINKTAYIISNALMREQHFNSVACRGGTNFICGFQDSGQVPLKGHKINLWRSEMIKGVGIKKNNNTLHTNLCCIFFKKTEIR